MIHPPWTKEQVDALNRWQQAGHVHPFTCPRPHALGRILVAHETGWRCPYCDYEQTWAHEFMLTVPELPAWFKDHLT